VEKKFSRRRVGGETESKWQRSATEKEGQRKWRHIQAYKQLQESKKTDRGKIALVYGGVQDLLLAM
jgi:hypothetical protein